MELGNYKEIAILILLLVAAVCVFKIVIRILSSIRRIDIDSLSINEKWVDDVFYDYAFELTRRAYSENGKPVRTKAGDYRANFLNDVDKNLVKVKHDCLDGDLMCDGLCRYAGDMYERVRVKDLYGLIEGYTEYRKEKIREDRQSFLSDCEELTPEEFFEIKPGIKGDIVGCYIIHNESRDMYYVGQAKRLFFRINQHFTGHGNGDVYADYKYGDDFSIRIVPLSDSGYSDIDLLEKDLIDEYDALNSGYNRTSGNG